MLVQMNFPWLIPQQAAYLHKFWYFNLKALPYNLAVPKLFRLIPLKNLGGIIFCENCLSYHVSLYCLTTRLFLTKYSKPKTHTHSSAYKWYNYLPNGRFLDFPTFNSGYRYLVLSFIYMMLVI